MSEVFKQPQLEQNADEADQRVEFKQNIASLSHSASQIPQLNASSISVEKGAQFLRVSVTMDKGST